MKKPDWCPNKNCLFKIQLQDMICIGELPSPIFHDGTANTHRICCDTRESANDVFDLQINKCDA